MRRRVVEGALLLSLLAGQSVLAQEESPPPLKLPDVVIYGRDILRVESSKGLEASYSSILSVKESKAKLSKEDLALVGVEKETLPGEAPQWKDWMVEVRTGYGSFSSMALGLSQGMKMGNLHYLASLDYGRRGDWVPNSRESEGEFRTHLGYRFPDRVATSAELGYCQKDFGYYGSANRQERGTFKCLEGKEMIEIGLARSTSLSISALERWDRLDSSTIWLFGGPNEIELDLSAAFSVLLVKQALRSRLQYVYQHNSDSFENSPFDRNLLSVGVGGDFSVPRGLSGSLDIAYQRCRSDDHEESRSRLSPFARIAYPLNEKVFLFASYEPKIILHTQSRLFRENNYFLGGYGPVEDRWLDFSMGVQGEYLKVIEGTVAFGVERRRKTPIWQRTGGDYDVSASDEVAVAKGRIDLRSELTDRLTLESSILYEDIRETTAVGEAFPYHPKEKVEAIVRYTPLEGTEIGTSLSYQGKRFTDTGEELDRFLLVGVQASQELFRSLKIWGRADNLLNASYELWKDYPMPGRSFTAGLAVEL